MHGREAWRYRRNNMNSFTKYCLSALWTISGLMAIANATTPPNVVFILTDDMGWNDVSFHGSDQILTPNIDALAYNGVILQQYYSEAICTPTRAALLTGQYPMRVGMHGAPLLNSEDRGIPPSVQLLPSYMKDLGYATHLVGKWHVGMSRREYLPTERGYDSHYGMRGGLTDYYTYNLVETWDNGRQLFGFDLYDNDVPQEDEQRYIIDALTDRAVNVIHQHNTSSPLFLHFAHNAPHSGNVDNHLQPPLYTNIKNQHIANSNRRLYAEIVNKIDQSVGCIVRALAEKQILDDTIIIFASDNGAPTIGQFNNWGVNLPFRGLKNTPWEGGVRVPAFIWHSSFRPRVWDGLMHVTDWLPTLTAAAGGQAPTNIDGVNQWDSIVQDGASKRNDVLLSIYDMNSLSYGAYRAGDYKIILGNLTGLDNDYYGEKFVIDKGTAPDYFQSLTSCEVVRVLRTMGYCFDIDEVQAMRAATMVIQKDSVRDSTSCVPSPTRGCLFNIRLDPTESHDLWDCANYIATLLEQRLRNLWAMQNKRGPINVYDRADPAYYNYTWTPWLPNTLVANPTQYDYFNELETTS